MKTNPGVPLSFFLPSWMRTRLLPIGLGTELHAILPPFLLGLLACGVCLTFMVGGLTPGNGFAYLANYYCYAFACVAIGACAWGRDFSHRTLGTTLCLPVARSQIRETRNIICLVAMLILCAFSMTGSLLFRQAIFRFSPIMAVMEVTAFIAPLLSGLLVAPWLTLVFRSALAGTVFTIALTGAFWFLSQLVSSPLGVGQDVIGDYMSHRQLMFGLLVALWALAAGFGPRKFYNLELIDHQPAVIKWPFGKAGNSKRVAAKSHRRAPLLQLIFKELRLQRVTLGLGLAGVVVLGALYQLHLVSPELDADNLVGIGLLMAYTAASVAGGLASAEERQMGTIGWQLALPVSASRQWAVKSFVAFACSAICGGLVPAWLLFHLNWGKAFGCGWSLFALALTLTALVVTAISLYLSSLASNSLKAMLMTFPTGLALGVLVLVFDSAGGFKRLDAVLNPVLDDPRVAFAQSIIQSVFALFLATAFGAWLFTLLRHSRANHTQGPVGLGIVFRQAFTLTLLGATVLLLLGLWFLVP